MFPSHCHFAATYVKASSSVKPPQLNIYEFGWL